MRILILIIVFECSRCQAAALQFRSIWGKHYYIICEVHRGDGKTRRPFSCCCGGFRVKHTARFGAPDK